MFCKTFVLSQISVIVKAKLGSPIFLLKSNSEFTFYFPKKSQFFMLYGSAGSICFRNLHKNRISFLLCNADNVSRFIPEVLSCRKARKCKYTARKPVVRQPLFPYFHLGFQVKLFILPLNIYIFLNISSFFSSFETKIPMYCQKMHLKIMDILLALKLSLIVCT